MIVKIPCSIGELVDKITILEIKSDRVLGEEKIHNIQNELDQLRDILSSLKLPDLYVERTALKNVNLILWEIEDAIRKKELDKKFDDEFILLARKVYLNNDERARIKKQINQKTGSEIVEEKSYTT
jgi:hypothetical protein